MNIVRSAENSPKSRSGGNAVVPVIVQAAEKRKFAVVSAVNLVNFIKIKSRFAGNGFEL